MESLTFALVVIVATFGIQYAVGFKASLIQFAKNTNLGNNVVTIYNRDGENGNVVVVEIRDKDEDTVTKIVSINDKDIDITVNPDNTCIVTYLKDEEEGDCTELVKMPSEEIPALVAEECEGREVYFEQSKPCNDVSTNAFCVKRCYIACWYEVRNGVLWLVCGEKCYLYCV